MTRWGMVIDAARCVGCQACTVACKTENQSPVDAWYAPVIEWEQGEFPDATLNYLPVLCNHCSDAPCVTACPSGALKRRDDGIVIADEDVCIGSRACMTACPYGALHFFEDRGTVSVDGFAPGGTLTADGFAPGGTLSADPSGRGGAVLADEAPVEPAPSIPERYAHQRHVRGAVSKCTYCAHKIDFGIENGLEVGVHPLATPACVVTCPAECRIFGDLDDPDSNVSRYLAERGPGEVLRPDAKTLPNTQYVGLP